MGEQIQYPPTGGSCVGQPTHWWFPNFSNRQPVEERKQAQRDASKAVSICNQCSIRLTCLDYSLEWEPFGIWGGIPEIEREKLRKSLNIKMKRPTIQDVLGVGNRAL